jgi:hypothetical protein
MKSIDLFLGVKAEQTLRDAVRAATDEGASEQCTSELCPVGQKDWIAGQRIDGPTKYGELAVKKTETLKGLIELQSHQRIRRESIRVHAVRKPVPVFKDPLPDNFEDEAARDTPIKEATVEDTTAPDTQKDDNSATCPVCGTTVHTYNIQYDPWGKMVGCYLCRGDSSTHGNGS